VKRVLGDPRTRILGPTMVVLLAVQVLGVNPTISVSTTASGRGERRVHLCRWCPTTPVSPPAKQSKVSVATSPLPVSSHFLLVIPNGQVTFRPLFRTFMRRNRFCRNATTKQICSYCNVEYFSKSQKVHWRWSSDVRKEPAKEPLNSLCSVPKRPRTKNSPAQG
jgi:hypothetical protein